MKRSVSRSRRLAGVGLVGWMVLSGVAMAEKTQTRSEERPRQDPPAAVRHQPPSGSGSTAPQPTAPPRGGTTSDHRRGGRIWHRHSRYPYYPYGYNRHLYPGFSLYWDFWGYPYYYPYGAGWGPYPSWGYTTVYPTPGAEAGALDLDVSPEKAQIYVDGQYLGVCDDFDGFPTYLWLPKGTYDVAIYMPGFRTIARQYSIYPGLVIDVEDRMEPGEAVKPEDLVSKSHERRDERLRREAEIREELEQREQSGAQPYRAEEAPPRSARGHAEEQEAGRLKLSVVPDDASVYLDGRFLGTGEELSRLHAGLIVEAGEHTLEVVRPGHQSEESRFSVRAGGEVDLRIELKPQ